MMESFISFIHLLSLVFWIGGIVFFSFFAAPAIFKTLDQSAAGDLVGVIFPRYYALGYVCSIVTGLTLALGGDPIQPLKLGLLVLMMLCTFSSGLFVHPKARALKEQIQLRVSREEQEALQTKFKSLHSLAVKLNGGVLLAGIGLLWLTATGLKL